MNDAILTLRNITKQYPGVLALYDVSLEFRRGEVHALLGENGAGKSTLIKVISGAERNDEGSIEIDGESHDHMTPKISRAHGIEVIYQEHNLINSLTVAENILLGKRTGNLVDQKGMVKTVQALFDLYHINLDPGSVVKDLSPACQQLVEIAKAISKKARILVMDEPTAQLTLGEVENLYGIIRTLKAAGTTIIYISHRLEELFTISDRVSIMRDGRYVTTKNTSETTRKELIQLMVGRELTEAYPSRNFVGEDVVLEVKNLYSMRNENVSFKLHKGEILGFAGLVGAGRTELARAIFGADRKLGGKVYLKGKLVNVRSPRDAIRHGIGLIPEDRKQQGCFFSMPVDWNITIASIRQMASYGVVSNRRISEKAEWYRKVFNIKTPSLAQKVGNLSGGNQQKVVLAKALMGNPEVVIFDEPTRGIDVGARHEFYNLMNSIVKDGKAIMMISSDMVELLGMCDRIIVIADGRISGVVPRSEFSQNRIMELASCEHMEGQTHVE